MTAKLTVLALMISVCGAVGAQTAPLAADQIQIKEKPEFMASLGINPDAKAPKLSKEEKHKRVEQAYYEKTSQHFMSKHAEKGVTCVSCHTATGNGGVAWMAVVGKPGMKQNCKDCHPVQAESIANTDTHSKLDCVACHLPNVLPGAKAEGKDAQKALRRIHTYKINVDPAAQSFKEIEVEIDGKKVKAYELAKDEDGKGYVDLMWSCARNTPADYTVFEGQGCHADGISTLDPGLVYQDQKEVYGEVQKWQKLIKESYDRVIGASKRIAKLLEVTKLSRADQTEVRLLIDKAQDLAKTVKDDGSWGVHGPRYLKDKIQTAEAFLDKAQRIIDDGGYKKPSDK